MHTPETAHRHSLYIYDADYNLLHEMWSMDEGICYDNAAGFVNCSKQEMFMKIDSKQLINNQYRVKTFLITTASK